MLVERIERDPGLDGVVRLGIVELEGIGRADDAALAEIIAAAVEQIRAQLAGRTAGQIPRLAAARQLYRAFGIDPTRLRPSPEALIRRLLKGQEFPRVHPAVDLGNLWAIESGLPIGLYDEEKIAGRRIALRRGLPGESYAGIRKPEIHLEGKLVLADEEGPFGNPSADSLRTSVTSGTRSLLYVMFAPASVEAGALDLWAAWLRERAAAILDAEPLSAVMP